MKLLPRLAAGVAITLATAAGTVQVADAAVGPGTAVTGGVMTIQASAPCVVTGYSLHAMDEMAADRIGSDQVENVVHSTCSRARRQSNNTWRYTNGKITVIANNNGYIVTVWRN